MTPRERVKAAIGFKSPDKTPLWLFNKDVEDGDVLWYDMRISEGEKGEGYHSSTRSEWGYTWHNLSDGTMGQPDNPVLPDWDDFRDFQTPPINPEKRLAGFPDFAAKSRDHYRLAMLITTGFTTYTFLRGFENAMVDFKCDPEQADLLLSRIFAWERALIDLSADAGFDGFHLGDDWGTQNSLIIHPTLWRKVFKPYYRQLVEHAHRRGLHIWFHSCGHFDDIIEDLHEIGVDVINISQPNVVDCERASRLRGKQCFMVPVSYQTVSLSGTAEEIAQAVRQNFDWFAADTGGYIGYVEEYGCMGMSEENYQACVSSFQSLQFRANPLTPYYPATNYDEPYRGQFHFSSQGGWMNDINGLWHDRGRYYMCYQSNPEGSDFEWFDVSIALASSPDLLHWKQEQVVLRHTENGAPGSGSTVVDTRNVSGLQTGENPPFLTFYSGSTTGVCLIYSCDLGKTWQHYGGNPLINYGCFDPRDPHVFYHPKSGRWILAIYGPERGHTSFYRSANLLDWAYASTLDFGYECPDIFELPVDGDETNTKWALVRADGQYILGDFDGERFAADDLTGRPLDQNHSKYFYAAQSFFRDTFPDRRVVQIAWMGNWSCSASVPEATVKSNRFRQCASFPAAMKLVSTPDGLRLTRNPIEEIRSLYQKTHTFVAMRFSLGENAFGVSGECFDFTMRLDCSAGGVLTILFADKRFTLDLENRTFEGCPVPSDGDELRVRFLRDKSHLEVFGADGLFSWQARVPFEQGNGQIRVLCDRAVQLLGAQLHTIASIW